MRFPDARPALARGLDRLADRWVLLLQIGVSVLSLIHISAPTRPY